MRVTQQLIADKLGLTQSTVARILNKNPRDTYSPDTVKRVLETARDLGYTINHKRTFMRKDLNILCEWEIRLKDKTLYSRGKALVKDISRDGLALANVESEGPFIPTKPFTMEVAIPEVGIEDLQLRCEPVRISLTEDTLEVGVRFIGLQKKRLRALRDAFAL